MANPKSNKGTVLNLGEGLPGKSMTLYIDIRKDPSRHYQGRGNPSQESKGRGKREGQGKHDKETQNKKQRRCDTPGERWRR